MTSEVEGERTEGLSEMKMGRARDEVGIDGEMLRKGCVLVSDPK